MNLKRELLNLFWLTQPRTTTYTVAGRRYRVPLQRGADRAVHAAAREPWLDDILGRLCGATGAVLLDVGANCGQTLLKAKAVNPGVRYVGFEPNPSAAGYLQSLIHLNGLSDCRVLCCALGRQAGIATLAAASTVDPAATLVPNFRGGDTGPQRAAVLVEVGDDLVERLGLDRVDMVKVDVEGAEAAALAGLARSLARWRPAVVCEVLRSHDPEHPTHAFRRQSKTELGELFERLGYRAFGLGHGAPVAVAELCDDYLNYLFQPI